ncbi:unnamed protein product, partial [Polarella glacialis]
VVSQGDSILGIVPDGKKRAEKIYNLVNSYAKDPMKGLKRKELSKVPLRIWCKPAAEGDEEGALPCDDGEEYALCDDEEFSNMEKVVQEHLARRGPGPTPQSDEPLTHRRHYHDLHLSRPRREEL